MGTKGLLCALALGWFGCGGDDGAAVVPDAEPIAIDADYSCNVLFLNFEGAALTAGADDAPNDSTSIIPASVTAPAYRVGDPDRDTKIGQITAQITNRLAPLAIDVVTERPTSGDFVMAMIGGASEDVGLQVGFAGIAPFAGCDNPIENRIVFAFDHVGGASTSTLTTGSVVIGGFLVSLGLPTSDDPMNCLCWDSPDCTSDVDCQITGADTPRFATSACGSGDTFDERAMIQDALVCP